MKWVELQVYPDILELPFRGTQACGLPVLHGRERKLGAPWASLSPPTPAGALKSSLSGLLRPCSAGPRRGGGAARSWGASRPLLGPKQAWPCGAPLSRQFRNGSFWRHGPHISHECYQQAGSVFVWEGVWEKTCMGGGLWLVLITWYLVVDIWSVGCIMAEMVLHKVLFPGRDCILHREIPGADRKAGSRGGLVPGNSFLETGTPCFWDSVFEAVSQDCCKLKAKIEVSNLSHCLKQFTLRWPLIFHIYMFSALLEIFSSPLFCSWHFIILSFHFIFSWYLVSGLHHGRAGERLCDIPRHWSYPSREPSRPCFP